VCTALLALTAEAFVLKPKRLAWPAEIVDRAAQRGTDYTASERLSRTKTTRLRAGSSRAERPSPWKRLAPGVLDELQRVTPRDTKGRRKNKYFQYLTSNLGYPKLREHLGSVVTLMKLSRDWDDFTRKLDQIHPRVGDTIPMPLDEGPGL